MIVEKLFASAFGKNNDAFCSLLPINIVLLYTGKSLQARMQNSWNLEDYFFLYSTLLLTIALSPFTTVPLPPPLELPDCECDENEKPILTMCLHTTCTTPFGIMRSTAQRKTQSLHNKEPENVPSSSLHSILCATQHHCCCCTVFSFSLVQNSTLVNTPLSESFLSWNSAVA